MKVPALPKAIYDRAIAAGATSIELAFSGGSDEGYPDVTIYGPDPEFNTAALEKEIEDWAFEAFDYSGTGDGSSYGDNIEYDLVAMTVSTSAWYCPICDCPGEFKGGNLQVGE
jgi:hypothetical protein